MFVNVTQLLTESLSSSITCWLQITQTLYLMSRCHVLASRSQCRPANRTWLLSLSAAGLQPGDLPAMSLPHLFVTSLYRLTVSWWGTTSKMFRRTMRSARLRPQVSQSSCRREISSGRMQRQSATRCVGNQVTIRGWFRQQPNIYPALTILTFLTLP